MKEPDQVINLWSPVILRPLVTTRVSIQKRTTDSWRSSIHQKLRTHHEYYFLTFNPTLSLNVYKRHVRSLPALPVPTPEAQTVLQTPWCPSPHWATGVRFRRVFFFKKRRDFRIGRDRGWLLKLAANLRSVLFTWYSTAIRQLLKAERLLL